MAHDPPLPPGIDLIVFARTIGSAVKTRIAAQAGQEAARAIYRELLRETAAGLASLAHHVAFTGGDEPGELRSCFPKATSFFPQTGGDLGGRMRMACLHRAARGARGFIVVGCDCPERPAADLLAAARGLIGGADVVLGPANDGGYHLAGVNGAGLAIFEATRWGRGDLMEETLSIVKRCRLRVELLPARGDIDTLEDYQRWKKRVTASAAPGQDPATSAA